MVVAVVLVAALRGVTGAATAARRAAGEPLRAGPTRQSAVGAPRAAEVVPRAPLIELFLPAWGRPEL